MAHAIVGAVWNVNESKTYVALSKLVQAVVAAICFWAPLPLDQYLTGMASGRRGALKTVPFRLLKMISHALYPLHAKRYQIPFGV